MLMGESALAKKVQGTEYLSVMKNPGTGTGRRQMEGMEGYVEIAGTDSAAERTTYQTTSQNNSSTAQLDIPEQPDEVQVEVYGEVYGEGHTEVKLRPPSRASIDWSGSDITARNAVHIPGVPTVGAEAEPLQKVEASSETCDVGDKCVEIADLIKLEDRVLDTTRVGSNIKQATSSKDQVPSDPGNMVTPDPGFLATTDPVVTHDPGNQATTDPGNMVTPDPGCLATTDPGNMVTPDPGCLATTDSENPVTSDPGNQVTPASPDIRPADEIEETKWPSVKKMVAEIAAGPVVVHRNMSKQTPIRQGLPARRYSLQSTGNSLQSSRESLQSSRDGGKASSNRRFSSDVPRFISENKPVVENIQNKDMDETTCEGLVTDHLDKSDNDITESKEFDTESRVVDNPNSESNENFDQLYTILHDLNY